MENCTIHSSFKEFSEEICACIYECYQKSVEENGRFTFVLSGGNTPKAIFEYLADHYLERINWSKVYFFWLDERCTEPSNLDSNYFMAYQHLLSKLQVVGGVYRMKGEIEKKEAALTYLNELKHFFEGDDISFDFILIGMGTDGHVASIFPGEEQTEKVKAITFATEKKYGGYYRLSLGIDVINASKFNLLMLKGKEKIKVFKKKDKFNLLPKDYIKYSHVICLNHE